MLTELIQGKHKKKNKMPLLSAIGTSLIISMVAGMTSVFADDTEIFTAGIAPPPESSNVVFMIDTSGSMGNPIQGDNSGTAKMQVVKNVFEQLLFENGAGSNVNPAMEGLKIALMRFDDGATRDGNSNGGYFIHRMRTLNNGSVNGNDGFWSVINGLNAGGFTPLAETAFEAARFFKGETPHFTDTSPGTNVSGVLQDGHYKSPFTDGTQSQCGINNHLVILTDGLPTRDGDADTLINELPGTTDECTFSEANDTDCLPQVAEHLYSTDLFDELAGEQKVMTHTIAFDLRGSGAAIDLLARTAENGGGLAADANSAEELAQAIENILAELPENAQAFVNPAASVSSSNQFVHDNTVYFGLFKPEVTPMWVGNVKGYQYDTDGELVDFSTDPQPAIVDGAFSPTARSKWSTIVDGANIDQGGSAEQILNQSTRSIWTQNSTNPSASYLVPFSVTNENNIPAADFGNGISNEQKIEIIQWATSRDSNPIGDPLHSTPQIINYGGDIGPVLFFGTNQGFMHAIRTENGQELMAFIPKSLLGNLNTIRNNNAQNDHPYGLDGHISFYRYDADGNGQIEANSDDRVIVIIGMRRGGNEYFVLDVTNPTDPTGPRQLMHIVGGSDTFPDMGDTWAKPIITQMYIGETSNPTRHTVALIAGGYNNQYDDLANTTVTGPSGAALYAIDLDTQQCLWSANDDDTSSCAHHTTVAGMTNGIPSHISAIDLTADGVVDRLYAIDIMGKIFRIDLNALNEAQTEYDPDGQLFADLSGGTRRFYYGVDVAYTNTGFTPKLHLTVGSGHRAHPLAADSSDVIYSVWDVNVLNPLPEGFTAITTGSLSNLTALNTEISPTSNGWYLNLAAGEKVLSTAASLAGYVFLTTYLPPDPDAPDPNPCETNFGSGYVYAVSLYNADPLNNARAIPITSTGIPSSVAFMTLYQPEGEGDPDNPLASQDTEVFAMVNGTKVALTPEAHNRINSATEATKTYWYIGLPEGTSTQENTPQE